MLSLFFKSLLEAGGGVQLSGGGGGGGGIQGGQGKVGGFS